MSKSYLISAEIDETVVDPNHQPIEKENLVTLDQLIDEVFDEKEKQHYLLDSADYDERHKLFKLYLETLEEYTELEQSYDRVLQADLIYQRKLLIEKLWNIFDSAS